MRSRRAAWIGLAVVATIAVAALRSAPSADSSAAKVTRWEITAKVANGSQILTRISSSSTPGHRGAGNIESKWSAEWRVRVRTIGAEVYIIGANGFRVTGTASGQYRGYYPKAGGATGTYTCDFGPITPARVLTHLKLYGQGRTDGKVDVSIGVNGEPGVLPPLKCAGDLVEPDVAKTLSAGVLTGIESGCFGDPTISGAKLVRDKEFAFTKRFGWHPPSPGGQSRPCNGFGAPIWSSASGTLKLTFEPVT